MIAATPADIARPFLWLAGIGFLVGFLGYVLLGGGAQALTDPRAGAEPAATAVDSLSLAQDVPRQI